MKALSIPSRFVCPLGLGTTLLLAGHPAWTQDVATSSQAQLNQINVILADDGGLDAQTARTLRSLTINALRKQGKTVSNDPALDGVHPIGQDTQALLQRLGGRHFALRLAGRLGTKLPLSLEEVKADGTLIQSASMTASSIEECDIVIPRLVEALLEQKPVESTARIATVTNEEARPFLHRPGDNHFVIGMLSPTFSGKGEGGKSGITMGYLYSAEHFMLGVEGFFVKSADTDLGSAAFFHGEWLPLDGDFSPYLGAGIGYLGGSDGDADITTGVGYKLTAGLEFFRLRHMRVQVGMDVYFPSSRETKTVTRWTTNGSTYSEEVKARSSYPVLHVKLAF